VTVRDEGRGITAGFLPHVFDSFCREERPEQPPAEGSGVGLTGVRHLAHKHGGFVEAQSPGPGCGATFVLTLPIDRAAASEGPGHHYGTLRGAHGFRTGARPELSAVHDRPRRHVN
jgi:K+-sensing histidine kinase KdpD